MHTVYAHKGLAIFTLARHATCKEYIALVRQESLQSCIIPQVVLQLTDALQMDRWVVPNSAFRFAER